MKQPVKCDPKILQFLRKVENKHIDYLVDVLTDNGRGRLVLSSSIKDLLLAEKVEQDYTEEGLRLLLHELQEYGGHSLINKFRSNPLPYSELLTDVHRKLNGSESQKKSAHQKEREIVLSLFGNEWQSLEDHERWERCTKIKVVTGFFDMSAALDVDRKGSVTSLSTAANTATFLGRKLFRSIRTDSYLLEASRITIPFVAHIAMLKMLYPSETG
ncbi:hypothetical protein [Acetobacter aceti]|uniref:DUF3944 domain-containing protein n=1 Tax=Acetobacter aceti TaxID=435 RepID=A0A6S6PK17_ACEAC|nr:hypothetical protein [Acetobacter aceti]BCI67709.1 hypothetical protein AAJCM20276_23330 [Acetobacter aceti]